MNDNLLALFRQTGALFDRLLLVRSRLHSRQFFSAPPLLPRTDVAAPALQLPIRECDRDLRGGQSRQTARNPDDQAHEE